MENNIQIVQKKDLFGKSLTIYGTKEEPIFLAKEIAEWIDYSFKDGRRIHRDVSKMLLMVDEDEKQKSTLKLGGEDYSHGGVRGNTEMWFLTEDGLYEILMQSRKPIAKSFKKEVKKILKEIRKHGFTATDTKLEEMIANPDIIIGFANQLKRERKEKQELTQVIEQNKPKVLFADAVATSKTTILIGELAKILKQNGVNIGQNRLFEWMRQNGYLISRKGTDYNMPTQRSMNLELFEIKETPIIHSDGHITVSKTTKVKGKGQRYFVNKFLNVA